MKTDSGSEHAEMHVKLRFVHFSSDVSSKHRAAGTTCRHRLPRTRAAQTVDDVTAALLLEERKCRPEQRDHGVVLLS